MLKKTKRQYSLKSKLSVSYIILACFLILIISIVSNIVIEKQFIKFIKTEHTRKNEDFVKLLSENFSRERGWKERFLNNAVSDMLEQGLIVKITNLEGNTIYDIHEDEHEKCDNMIQKVTTDMEMLYPKLNGGYVEDIFDLNVDGEKIATISIGYYGPFYFNENAIMFVDTLNKVLIIIGIGAVIISIIVGLIISGNITKPILKVVTAANEISEGNYIDIAYETNIREINNLTTSITGLSKTLSEQSELRRRLTSDLSHELRTPLATLKAHIEAMIDGVWEPTAERLASCNDEIERITNLVAGLDSLEKAREEENLKKTAFDIYELISNIICNFQAEAKNTGVELAFNAHECIVYADKNKMGQLVNNIISNSVKHSFEKGVITIDLTEKGKFIKLMFQDTGIGIPEKDLPHIFERLYRSDVSRNRETGGSGIGLSIVKAIVDEHGGKIFVESKVDNGTKTTVELPIKV